MSYHRLVPGDEDTIIELAWSDDAPFEAIEKQFGMREAHVIALMRERLKPSSFRLWRRRVSGRTRKHAERRTQLELPMTSSRRESEGLRAEWRRLIEERLPAAAPGRGWPVEDDHCFARILLDNACERPWRQVLPAPAWRHAPPAVLERAIELGEAVLSGDTNLNELQQRSLELRRALR